MVDKNVSSERHSARWTDAELASAVETYVFLLRLQYIGLPITEKNIMQTLVISNRHQVRNQASIRYRMRNISAVSKELGGPILKLYSPAERVGAHVRQRIAELLRNNVGFEEILATQVSMDIKQPFKGALRGEALHRLNDLRVHIKDLERELIGIGHNHPPQPLHAEGPKREDFARIYADIDGLEDELRREIPNQAAISKQSNGLLTFGLKVLQWLAVRATIFTDASLKLAAPVLVAKATGLFPVLETTLKAVLQAVGH